MNMFIIILFVVSITFIIALMILRMLYKDNMVMKERIERITTNPLVDAVNKQQQKMRQDRSADSNLKIMKKLANELSMSGVLIRPSEFVFIWAVLSFIPSTLILLISRDFMIALAILLVGVFLPPFFLHRKKTKRVELFEKQLAEAVTVICNCLRAGLTFQQALISISNEMPEPISKEIGKVLREVKLGINLDKALNNMTERLKSKDSELIVSAVLIQRQIGGNLSEILSSISVTITERYKIKSEIRVLTTTGRTSGIVVGVMPVLILLFFMLVNPGYVRSFFDTTLGTGMLIAGAVLEIIGFLVIRKIVNIKY